MTITNAVEQTLRQELRRTQPDYVVYVPASWDDTTNDSHNEHLLVFDGPDGSLMAIWTQAWHLPGKGNINHIVFARSPDGPRGGARRRKHGRRQCRRGRYTTLCRRREPLPAAKPGIA